MSDHLSSADNVLQSPCAQGTYFLPTPLTEIAYDERRLLRSSLLKRQSAFCMPTATQCQSVSPCETSLVVVVVFLVGFSQEMQPNMLCIRPCQRLQKLSPVKCLFLKPFATF